MPRWSPTSPYWIALRLAERRVLEEALAEARGLAGEAKAVPLAAQMLGIDAGTLRARCRVIGVEIPRAPGTGGTARSADRSTSLPNRVPDESETKRKRKYASPKPGKADPDGFSVTVVTGAAGGGDK